MSKSGKKNTSKTKDRDQRTETIELENTGNYLRTLRLGKGLSIKDVAEATRISVSNLNAIEDQNFSSLPANTFTRGLLNIYANFLGADAEAVIRNFMEERGNSPLHKQRSDTRQSRAILTPKRLAEPSHMSSVTMAGILFLFIIASFTAYSVYTSWNPFSFLMKKNGNIQSVMPGSALEEKSVPDPRSGEKPVLPIETYPFAATPPQPVNENPVESSRSPGGVVENTAEPVVEQQPETRKTLHTVTIHFLKDTALELALGEDETIAKDFKAGDSGSWSAGSLTLTFSQPDSAEILVNNSPITFPEGKDGDYTLRIPQDTTELPPDE
ncbi:MAG TPA: helix-turn-helix domain-containing protein [Desulfobacteraceae bacterium]|nr:helix-turn-helix domain-containing protein [Desulfobacteraceae bacterium]